MALKEVEIFTDGACSGNPGPGGYGAILLYGKFRRETSGGYRQTTNNRMELLGAIAALRLLKETCKVVLYSDSSYLVNAVSKNWLKNWKNTVYLWIKCCIRGKVNLFPRSFGSVILITLYKAFFITE